MDRARDRASVEIFPKLVDAFRRHAVLVTRLRASGWRQIGHTEPELS
jgi:hypothetical protein